MNVTVVGSGVVGLTAAVRLLEAGHSVEVLSRDPPARSTSAKAGAVWTVTSVEPAARTFPWAVRGREVYAELAAGGEAPVRPLEIVHLFRTDPGSSPWLSTECIEPVDAGDVPDGYAAAWRIAGFRIAPLPYLDWLSDRVELLGGRRSEVEGGIAALEDAPGEVVVNCAGLGAAALCDDRSMYPVRGQTVIVDNPGVERALSDETDPHRITYLYPGWTDVVLGGCRQPGRADLEPDPAETERILADVGMWEPSLGAARILDVRVGIRPGRPQVRLEPDMLADGRPVIHDYGHGGSGFTLSWGCAEEVAAMVGRAG